MSSNEMSPNESSYTKDEMMAVAASRSCAMTRCASSG